MAAEIPAGEYDAKLNGVRHHYTVRGSGPALIALSGGPGADARIWDDFAGIDAFCIKNHLPDARLEILKHSGHFGLIEEPDRFRQAVKEFVL